MESIPVDLRISNTNRSKKIRIASVLSHCSGALALDYGRCTYSIQMSDYDAVLQHTSVALIRINERTDNPTWDLKSITLPSKYAFP